MVVRRPPADASDQMVSHCTSLELKKRICRLAGESMRKKSKTPCWPGVRPVIREVQAGGVSGGTMVRKPARTPSAKNDFRNGMTPCSMRGSRTSKVAPSRPIRSVRMLIAAALWRRLPARAAEVRIHEIGQFVDRQIALLLADFGQQFREGHGGLVMFLYGGAQNHGIERFQSQLGEQQRLRAHGLGIIPILRQILPMLCRR